MTNFLAKKGSLVALAMICGGIVTAACSGEETRPEGLQVSAEDNSGSLGLNLTLSNGVVIDAVEATITGDALAEALVRTIPVPNEGATVSALFGGLPAGTYSIVLSADAADGSTNCSGEASFDVLAGETVGVTVPMTCDSDSVRGTVTVDGVVNVCPELEHVFVAPLQTAVGGQIVVEGAASDADDDDVSYAWTASAGSFDDPAAANTTYNCETPGDQTLVLTINDGGDCSFDTLVSVRCEPTAVCGDEVVEADKGEECDPPNGVSCDDSCQEIGVECGNEIVQEGEDCDPPNGTTCNADCEDIVCGDGVVEGAEECEPPNSPAGAGNCDAECKTIPSVCDNGIVEPGEDCDPPEAGVCDDSCQAIVGDQCEICQEDSCPGPVATRADLCADGACDAYLACQESSGCDEGGDVRLCYCGDVDFADCFNSFDANVPQGVCKDEINTLAGSTLPLQVGTDFFNAATQIGAVNQVNLCTATNCSDACY